MRVVNFVFRLIALLPLLVVASVFVVAALIVFVLWPLMFARKHQPVETHLYDVKILNQ